jgi:Protein of unknown function (DUF1097)
MKKTLILATVIAVLAGLWTVVVFNVKSFGDIPFIFWPTFIAWGAFFYAGATVDGLVKGIVQFTTGIVLAAVASYIYLHANLKDDNFLILAIVVFVIAWPITVLSGIPALKGYWAAVPAGFMGAAVFFGIFFFGNSAVAAGGKSASELSSAIVGFIPLASGLVLGWLSLQITNVLAAERKAATQLHAA